MLRSRLSLTRTVVTASGTTLGLFAFAASAAHAQFVATNIQTIDPPLAALTSPDGVSFAYQINNNGVVAGAYLTADAQSAYGFTYQNGNYTSVEYPDQVGTSGNETYLFGVNTSGVGVGYYNTSSNNFLRSSTGVFTTLAYPGASTTFLQSINDAGIVAGQYLDANDLNHGFTYDTNTNAFTAVPDAGGSLGNTFLQFVASNGDLVGSYNTVDGGPTTAFLYHNGVYSRFNFSGATETRFNGINAAGIVSGRYIDSNALSHGLIYNTNTGIYSTIDVPGATSTYLYQGSINNSNQIAGSYFLQDGTVHSFTARLSAAAPEPSALALLTIGGSVLGFAMVRRRRHGSGKTAV